MRERLRRMSWADGGLAVGGILGLLLYLFLLPGQHPDAAARFELDAEEAAQRAQLFASRHGVTPSEEANRDVAFRRSRSLLDSMQHELGRPRTVRLLKSDARERLPAYHWRVTWEAEDEENDVEVWLTVEGTPYGFEGSRSLTARRTVHREALAYALEDSTVRSSPPDSLLHRARAFDLDGPPDTMGSESEPPRTLRTLDRQAAVRLARYHVQQTALRDFSFQTEAVETIQQTGGEAAQVQFWGDAFHRQRLRVTVEIAPTGHLLRLEPTFNPEAKAPEALPAGGASGLDAADTTGNGGVASNEDGASVSMNSVGETLAESLMGLTYVVLALAVLFGFYRRLSARVVDTKAALRDALWGGLFAATIPAIPMLESLPVEESLGFWGQVLIIGASVLIVGLLGGVLIFLASGAMDSLARSVWPEKLSALSLVRSGVLRNVPVGVALLRGMAGAGVLLGLTTGLLALFPGAAIAFEEAQVAHASFGGFVLSLAVSGWAGLFVNLTVMLGVGALLYRWSARASVVVLGIALVLTSLQVALVSVRPLEFYAVIVGSTALLLAWMFWRYEVVVSFMAYLLSSVVWATSLGWMVEGAPAQGDAMLAFGVVGFVGLLGAAGVFSGRTSKEVPSYTPAYVNKLAEEERLKRELEIAREVHTSFLPRRMPEVNGLDVAALCLAANEVGGDYYDFVEVAPHRWAIIVGDVSGKGIQAAFFMTLVKGFLQTLSRETGQPAAVLGRLNQLFCANAPSGTFISLIYGVLDVAEGTFTFARAGHNPVVLKRRDQAEAELIRPSGMAIGLTRGAAFEEAIEEVTVSLQPGDVLALYTDGVSEAVNQAGKQFGTERLARRIEQASKQASRTILGAVADEVDRFIEPVGRRDDMTLVVLKYMGERLSGARSEPADAASSGERKVDRGVT